MKIVIIPILIILLNLPVYSQVIEPEVASDDYESVDLTYHRTYIPDADNAYIYFKKASDYIVEPEDYDIVDDFLYSDDWSIIPDTHLLAICEWLNDNSHTEYFILDGLEQKHCQFPYNSSLFEGNEIDRQVIINLRPFIRLFNSKARLAVMDGNSSKGIEHYSNALHVCDMIIEGDIDAVCCLRGTNLYDSVLSQLHDYLLNKKVGKNEIIKLKKTILPESITPTGLIIAAKRDYGMNRKLYKYYQLVIEHPDIFDEPEFYELYSEVDFEFIIKIHRELTSYFLHRIHQPWKSDFGFLETPFGKKAAEKYEKLDVNYWEDIFAECFGSNEKKFKENWQERMEEYVEEQKKKMNENHELLEARIIRQEITSKTHLYDNYHELKANLSGLKLVIYLLSYYIDNDRYPENLDSLEVQLPRDPFSGKPFHYSRERKIIWSVGPDGKNDNAKNHGVLSAYEVNDLVWDLPDYQNLN